ncbi:hypothetical protein AN477_15405 [Alicyclobacillus ferrooxydans]|uniref:Uncharacterized protein n=1 Tax=Alicyclobacillus ferrooxydans TaxID=471514 RepID=A0A0P9EUU2_9BACL|nr:hypothetical protein AN477_15405 [Alicyclobacillus ferrooxydans]
MTEQAFNEEEAISFGQLIAIAEAMYAPGLTNPPIPPDLSADWDVLIDDIKSTHSNSRNCAIPSVAFIICIRICMSLGIM